MGIHSLQNLIENPMTICVMSETDKRKIDVLCIFVFCAKDIISSYFMKNSMLPLHSIVEFKLLPFK
jgi:hypothetical protein